MTPHDHSTFVPGCYRCDIGRDEERRAMLGSIKERDDAMQHLRALTDRAVHPHSPSAAIRRANARKFLARVGEDAD